MGADQYGRCPREGGDLSVARVVPDVPTFAVDEGFRYAADETIHVGQIVRVPLGRRIVRGWVVSVGEEDPSNLKAIKAVSSTVPIFGTNLLATLKWASAYYISPVAAMLPRSGPPNLPHGTPLRQHRRGSSGRARSTYVMTNKMSEAVELMATAVGNDRTGMVILPTTIEVSQFASALGSWIGDRVVQVPPTSQAREATAAWQRVCLTPGRVAVGTHRIAFWPIADLAVSMLVEEGRRSMKDRQSPTVHAREVVHRRSLIERFEVLYAGSVPSARIVAAGVEIRRESTRAWPPVEIVDRRDDPPGTGLVADHTKRAIAGALARGGRVFAFSHRHGYAPAFRCASCKTLRVCPSCGARPEPGESCTRCGALLGACSRCGGQGFEPLGAGVGRVSEVMRRLFGDRVGPVGSEAAIWVGTERDVPLLSDVTLGVVVDMDGLVLGSAYNSGEEALRIVARLARAIPFGRGRHLIIQTSIPDHPVLEAVRSGDPVPYLREEVGRRREFGLPPTGEVIVIEVSGGGPHARASMAALGDEATIYGPAEQRGTLRWLVQGRDLAQTRRTLRTVVGSLREAGGTVRVDVDPLDL